MLELTPEFRHEVASAYADRLRRDAEPSPPGLLRRAASSGLMRLGLGQGARIGGRAGHHAGPSRPSNATSIPFSEK